MTQPEQQARESIDRLLHAAGWLVQGASVVRVPYEASGIETAVAEQDGNVNACYFTGEFALDTRKTCWEELCLNVEHVSFAYTYGAYSVYG